jgi:hypothetical protein
MKHLFKKIALAGLLLLSPIIPGVNNQAQAEGKFKPFHGISVGPFREGQAPGGSYPSELEYRQSVSRAAHRPKMSISEGNE